MTTISVTQVCFTSEVIQLFWIIYLVSITRTCSIILTSHFDTPIRTRRIFTICFTVFSKYPIIGLSQSNRLSNRTVVVEQMIFSFELIHVLLLNLVVVSKYIPLWLTSIEYISKIIIFIFVFTFILFLLSSQSSREVVIVFTSIDSFLSFCFLQSFLSLFDLIFYHHSNIICCSNMN